MEKEKTYTRDQIQAVWKQFHFHPRTVVWSDNNGETWNEVPSMDTGKWALFSIKEDGNVVDWIFRIK